MIFMEIGSFIELQFSNGKEFYKGNKNIIRLNSGRAAIWHAFRITGCERIWIPYYQCDSVRNFLLKKDVKIKFYYISDDFMPINLFPEEDEAILLVNYYGVMSSTRMKELSRKYDHVIIDNSQAFFCKPLRKSLSVYSARKFIGAPDGAYVIGEDAEQYAGDYEQCFSSDTANFLLQRIEYGCEGKTYESRMVNEHRIDREDIKLMSKLTRTILDGTDYEFIRKKRRENFAFAQKIFGDINKLNPVKYYADDCVPMVYPLLIEDDSLLDKLLKSKHFQGHWWSYLLGEIPEDTIEYWISRYVIPITIDQRYGKTELEYIRKIIISNTEI